MKESNVIVVDSVMGSGKTTWTVNELLNKNFDENVLYVTPYLKEIDRIVEKSKRKLCEPENHGNGKLGNIAKLLINQMDIAATHELFRRFDRKCINALKENEYTLILDETISAIEPYHFTGKDDFQYLLTNNDIEVSPNGMINWVGSELDTRFDDVRILAKNQCLFKVDDKFFLWHFPHEIFHLFKKVYVLTYYFSGSLMKYYFDLYGIEYATKSISMIDGKYALVDYYKPDKTNFRNRLKIYQGRLNSNISQKDNVLSATWSGNLYYKKEIEQIQKNFNNFARNIIKANSTDVMWTCYKSCKSQLMGKGYSKGFTACNCRATNDYQDTTCLMYGINWYENPEIKKFFARNGIAIDQDATALSTMLQWIWRSNIRVPTSNREINIYIPAKRMRNLLTNWLNE